MRFLWFQWFTCLSRPASDLLSLRGGQRTAKETHHVIEKDCNRLPSRRPAQRDDQEGVEQGSRSSAGEPARALGVYGCRGDRPSARSAEGLRTCGLGLKPGAELRRLAKPLKGRTRKPPPRKAIVESGLRGGHGGFMVAGQGLDLGVLEGQIRIVRT